MGKLLLWLKSIGAGHIPVYASASLVLQVGIQTMNQQNLQETLDPVEVKTSTIAETKIESPKALIKKTDDGFEMNGVEVDSLAEAIVLVPDAISSPAPAAIVASAARGPASSSASSSASGQVAAPPASSTGSISSSVRASVSSSNVSSSLGSSSSASSVPSGIVAVVSSSGNSSPATAASSSSSGSSTNSVQALSSSGDDFDVAIADTVPVPDTAPVAPDPLIQNVIGGTALSANTVSTNGNAEALSDTFYIAAISYTDDSNFVTAVSGLGLTWVQASSQCSNKGSVSVEIWYAFGTVGFASPVTALLNSTSDSSNIAVGTVNDVDLSSPIAGVTTANILGVDGDATCGSNAANAPTYNYDVTTIESSSVVISAFAFNKNFTHDNSSMTEGAQVNSGGNPAEASNVVIGESLSSVPSTINLNGEFSGGVRWSSVNLELKLLP